MAKSQLAAALTPAFMGVWEFLVASYTVFSTEHHGNFSGATCLVPSGWVEQPAACRSIVASKHSPGTAALGMQPPCRQLLCQHHTPA